MALGNLDYIRQSLADDEELVHVGHFHWMYTVSALLNIVFGVILCIFIIAGAIMIEPYLPASLRGSAGPGDSWLAQVRDVNPAIKILAFMVLAFSMFRYAQMMIVKVTTEIAITNKRLVYKRGLVARYVGEINIDRIEGVNVLQGILGRLLNYGRIMVRGMGVGEVVLPPIEDPLKFRRAIERARSV
ncbi:MAG: PH domain-containing protein [Micavibrio sp.]